MRPDYVPPAVEVRLADRREPRAEPFQPKARGTFVNYFSTDLFERMKARAGRRVEPLDIDVPAVVVDAKGSP